MRLLDLVEEDDRVGPPADGFGELPGLLVPCHRFDASLSVKVMGHQALQMVKLADEAGFNMAWFPEHHLMLLHLPIAAHDGGEGGRGDRASGSAPPSW